MQSPSVYSSVISPRSKRLRTTGAVLLAAAVAMVLYGYFRLMPSIERAIQHSPAVSAGLTHESYSVSAAAASPSAVRAHRVRKLQVAVALAYWGVCSLLVVAIVVIAWLDFREVTRTYMATRRAIWNEGAAIGESPPDDVG